MSKQICINEIVDDDARFANIEEIINCTELVSFNNNHAKASGIPVMSDGKNLRVDNSDTHSLIIGLTGSGKTRRSIYEMMLSMITAGSSIVVNDCKCEIYRYTKTCLEQNGYKVHVLNFRNPLTGNRYNLLKSAALLYKEGKIGEATEYFYSFSTSIFEPLKSDKDPFWTLESARYLTGLCLLACELLEIEDINLGNVYNIHVLGREKMGGTSVLRQYFNEERRTSAIWRLVEGTVMAPSDTQASILSVMTQGLTRILLNDDIADMMNNSDFDVMDIGREKTAVFLMTKDETSAYDSLVSSFVDQAYTELVSMAEKDYNGKLPVRVEFIMDEFGNMAKLNDMIKKVTASRSRNIRWHLVIQGMEQLSAIYGKEDASIIIGNCGSWCYMNSSDIELLKTISERCGEVKDEFTKEPHRLLTVSRLQHFDKDAGECLILLGRNRPYITYLPDISEYGIEPIESIDLPERERNQKPLFDIRKVVREELDATVEATLKEKKASQLPTSESILQKNLPFGEPKPDERIEEIVKRIDQKIKELEEQEANETAETEDYCEENMNLTDLDCTSLYEQYSLHLQTGFEEKIKEVFLDELLSPNGVRPLLSVLLLLGLGGEYGLNGPRTCKPKTKFNHFEVKGRKLVLVSDTTKFFTSIPNIRGVKVKNNFVTENCQDGVISYSFELTSGECLEVYIDLSQEGKVQRLFCLYQVLLEEIYSEELSSLSDENDRLKALLASLGYGALVDLEDD